MMEENKPNMEERKEFNQDTFNKVPAKRKAINYWKVGTLGLSILLFLSLVTNFNLYSSGDSKEEAAAKALDFINTNLLQGQTVADLEAIEDQGDVYMMKLSVSGQEIDGYITKDGKLFFPQAISLTEVPALDSAVPPAEVVKSDKPKVEVFVMSHCPYGTQIEKGMLPVAYLLGSKMDFSVKFVSYSMHGETEIKEQLNQYCIEKEQKTKFLDYLKCFLDEGDGAGCLVTAKIDQSKLGACTAKADQEFSVMENLADKSTWLSGQFPLFDIHKVENDKYGVQGSPTLVINGVMASAGRDSVSLLNAICDAFNTPPEECKMKLEATVPSAGFGWEASGSNNLASCGN
ncbi:MAG: hypothetical protein AABW48_04585 [Nanoarchaeota archaeon]